MHEIHLECREIAVTQLDPAEKETLLSYNETWVTLSAPPQALLSPAFWIEALAEKGMQCCFRYFP